MSSLRLADLEDFLPILPLSVDKCDIKNNDFVVKQFQKFQQETSEFAAIDYKEYEKLNKFKDLIFTDSNDASLSSQKNRIRRNFLYNLIYHKYQYDIQSIKTQTVFNNYYFEVEENGILKQVFVAMTQILFTILLLFEIIYMDYDYSNALNVALGIVVVYLTIFLIKPQITSVIHDFNILDQYFELNKLNISLNIMTNVVLAVLLPFITFFVILNSETMTDIVLNATAVSFIIELDDIVSNEIDFENWFVKAAVSVELLYKKVIPFNDAIITSNYINSASTKELESKLNDIKQQLQINNSNGTNLSCSEVIWGLGEILLFPLLLFKYPFDIFAALSNKKCSCCDSDKDEEEDKHMDGDGVIQKPSKIRSDSSGEEDHEEESKDEYVDLTEDNNNEWFASKAKPILTLNNEGNELMTKYMFSDACDKYVRATSKAKGTDFGISNILILWYNAGCALYERAQQSFISETITNRNGHSYTNYNRAIEYFENCKNWTDDKNLKAMCLQMLLCVFRKLYQDDDAIYFNLDSGSRHIDIQERKKLTASSNDIRHKYLEILDNMRQYLVRKTKQKQKDEAKAEAKDEAKDEIQSFEELNAVINDSNDTLFHSNRVLKGKYFSIRSDYYLMTKKEEEAKKDAERAKECSDLFAWKSFNLTDKPSKDLCQDIINEYTNQIEFDAYQPYYYYVRGRAYYALYERDKDKENVAYAQQALENFKRASDLESTNPTFWMRYGLCHFVLEDRENALKAFDSAIRLDSMKGFGNIYMEHRKGYFWCAYYQYARKDNDISQISPQQWKEMISSLDTVGRRILEQIQFDQYANEKNNIEIRTFETLLEERIAKDPAVYRSLLSYWEDLQNRSKYFNEDEFHPGFAQFKRMTIEELGGYISRWFVVILDEEQIEEEGWIPEKVYKQILSLLPRSINELLQSFGSFDHLSGDDGLIDLQEFQEILKYTIHQIIETHSSD